MSGLRRKKIRERERKEILGRLRDGQLPSQVARDFGRSESAVYKILRDVNTDHELGPHGRELYHLSRCIRDRLTIPLPTQALELGALSKFSSLWIGRQIGFIHGDPQLVEELDVENEWGLGFYDARTHSLFPLLIQHLGFTKAWDGLEELMVEFQRYLRVCQSSYDSISYDIEKRDSGLADRERKACAEFLLTDAYYRVAQLSGGLNTSYETERSMEDGKPIWLLKLGAWSVGRGRSPNELKTLAAVVKGLVERLPQSSILSTLGEQAHSLQDAIAGFQAALRPDTHLRNLVLQGHCNLCPVL